ncbi:MAG: bifunctional methylenetetrahydrofolate dehydrogenase/methenyltetrahydrofolate cyclohydrolase FolD [Planctomycetia bacterium]|nr:bifunctional methylenetetrahydrofolate dehydrogenase/methenyltetrahydrofolate cyclohydrolase FolD [Planctomycetia bacterium]
MSAKILDGKQLAETIRTEIGNEVAEFVAKTGIKPALAVILVGENPASQVYVRNKEAACCKAGMESLMFRLPSETSTNDLLALIDKLNADSSVHGILVQLPLPKGIDEKQILDSIDPSKDVDAFHPENVGLISQGRPRFLPCTPYGIQQLLVRYQIETAGKHIVILGRSDIVGKPMALLLVQKGKDANATVTICHSRTADLPSITRLADILIVAIGQAEFVTADMVKEGAVVIDVGMNRIEKESLDEHNQPCLVKKLVGDVDFNSVKEVASAITPVPGGVGPLTVTMLLLNTLRSAKQHSGKVNYSVF